MTENKSDIEILTQLNADYLSSDQNSNVARYDEFLAEDFTASLPDLRLYTRKEFLEMIAKPRPFTELKADNVVIRVLGDLALIHGHITFEDLKGVVREGRYTDEWQRQEGKWFTVGANVITEGGV